MIRWDLPAELLFCSGDVDYLILLRRSSFKLVKCQHQNIASDSLLLIREQTLLICPALLLIRITSKAARCLLSCDCSFQRGATNFNVRRRDMKC